MSNNVVQINPGISGGVYIPPGGDMYLEADKNLTTESQDIEYEFKILSLGTNKFKNTERNILLNSIDVSDDNSMVKVNKAEIKFYYNDTLLKDSKVYNRKNYDSNIFELNENISIHDNSNNNLNVFSLKSKIVKENTADQGIIEYKEYTPYKDEQLNIQKQYGEGYFKYEIIPINTDFEIDLSKHKISKTLYLNKSKDSLFGEAIYENIDDTYNQKYTNCKYIQDLTNNCSDIINTTKKAEINFGVQNYNDSNDKYIGGDYRIITQTRNTAGDIENLNNDAYYYSNIHKYNKEQDTGNFFSIKIKKINKQDFINYPTSNNEFKQFINNNLKLDSYNLTVSDIKYQLYLDGDNNFTNYVKHPETFKETEKIYIKPKYNINNQQFEEQLLVPIKKVTKPLYDGPYHMNDINESVIPEGSKNVLLTDEQDLELLYCYSKLQSKAERDDCRIAVALKNPNEITATANVEKLYSFNVKNDLFNDKQFIGQIKYTKFTDINNGITYYYQYDSDDKITLKLPNQQIFNNIITNSYSWIDSAINDSCKEELNKCIDMYHTYDNIKYYYINEGLSLNFNEFNEDKIIAFYINKNDLNNFSFTNLIQPKFYDETQIDSTDRDYIEELNSSTTYYNCRHNQNKYFRVVLLLRKEKPGNITFNKSMYIYNPIIYNATIVNFVDEDEKKSYEVCYDFRAPQLTLLYKEVNTNFEIEGHSLDKTYLPKPFYEIIN